MVMSPSEVLTNMKVTLSLTVAIVALFLASEVCIPESFYNYL